MAVSFFADRPADTDPVEEPEFEPKPWFGPPRGVLPGISQQRVVVFRVPDAVLVIERFEAYPSGVSFSVRLELRHPHRFLELPMSVFSPRHRPGVAVGLWRGARRRGASCRA